MRRLPAVIFISAFLAVIIACAAAPRTELPEWVFKPGGEDFLGGCGSAGPHIKGPQAQRELAVSRAVDELARQLSVEVSSVSAIVSSGSRDSARTDITSYSIQTSSGRTFRTKIRAVWQHPETDMLYVWVVLDDDFQ